MNVTIPELSLVVLIGASGSGKSTFAGNHFKPTEVLSSDYCRGLVSDDENSQAATKDAFDVLHFIASKRLAGGKLTVIDATNVQAEARKPLIALAREYHCLPVAIVLDMNESLCVQRNEGRADRNFGANVVRNHIRSLHQSIRGLKKEGFRHVFVLKTPEEIEQVTIIREPLFNDKRELTGPFDIIGDIHGCYEELLLLLEKLGYMPTQLDTGFVMLPPGGRKAIFLGDLVDRGPQSPEVLRLVMQMTAEGHALCVPGNHDTKLQRKLSGKEVQISHGLAETLEQLEDESPEFIEKVNRFLDGLISHYVLDGGRLVVAHAGMKAEMQGRGSAKVREFALYGETTGETDEFGLPVRFNWAEEYRGNAAVVYGHTPNPTPQWHNNTINIDTGCVFGGKLTALSYPERELVSVDALTTYCEPVRKFLPDNDATLSLSLQQAQDDTLEIADVIGKRLITTRLRGNITIREENATAALEVMSRFAVNPKWLIYLPPTMSPPETSTEPGFLERPTEAFTYYRNQGVAQVICEEKHMGSRVVVVVCKDEETARRRFGIEGETHGICYTRTGRRFFTDVLLEKQLLTNLTHAMTQSGLWESLETDWVCLDCELMPWSAKAQELLRQQYAAVGIAATSTVSASVALLNHQNLDSLEGIAALRQSYRERETMTRQFVEAYRRYCWQVHSLKDLKLAPFHILATEGKLHSNKNHLWHLETIAKLCAADPDLLLATSFRLVDVKEEQSVQAGVEWWTQLTEKGGEGMVVKPLNFVEQGSRGLVQPAVKCRGREYLRIIYGAEYTAEANLSRLRTRYLSGKRSLALREFALGIEALERFLNREPLRRVHECVFGILALESEPVDPRL